MLNSLSLLRQQANAFFEVGVKAADPYQAVKNVLAFDGQQITIKLNDNHKLERIGHWQQVHMLAFGKAACSMANAASDCLPRQLLANRGIAVCNYTNVSPITGFDTIGAGHPLPDQAGLLAAKRIAEILSNVKPNELVLVLISGGGSALLPLPVKPVTLDEKIATTELLLASGANINEINCVRKHLSQLKGGGMAKLASQADLHALILSDVLGDDISTIASGPTVADSSYFTDAIQVLKTFQVWEKTPASVRNYLLEGSSGKQPETPKPGDDFLRNKTHTLIGSNSLSISAIMQSVSSSQFLPIIYSQNISGEARLAAEQLACYAKNLQNNGLNQSTAIIAGGETTVTLSPISGRGGRNQELALAFALAAEQLELNGNWVMLSGGTDGQDGPTDAAGAIVDQNTLQRIRQTGLDPMQKLINHDAYPALQAANDLLITGATGTNVADLQILLLQPTH